MPLFLLEFGIAAAQRAELEPFLEKAADAVRQSGGEITEIQVGQDLNRLYIIAEHEDRLRLTTALDNNGLAFNDVAQVRLVGATLEEVKASRVAAEYLVEWDLPKDLTMDRYLQRKKDKSPLYANVPEVRFLRTYVREDMMKCLCFYQAPDEEAVRRAREAVSAPVSRLTKVASLENVPN